MGAASKAHQTISYRVTAATITLPTAVTYPIPTGCRNFIVTNLIVEGVCVGTLAYAGDTKLIIRSAAASYSSFANIWNGLMLGPVSAAATITLTGAGVGYAVLIGYWD